MQISAIDCAPDATNSVSLDEFEGTKTLPELPCQAKEENVAEFVDETSVAENSFPEVKAKIDEAAATATDSLMYDANQAAVLTNLPKCLSLQAEEQRVETNGVGVEDNKADHESEPVHEVNGDNVAGNDFSRKDSELTATTVDEPSSNELTATTADEPLSNGLTATTAVEALSSELTAITVDERLGSELKRATGNDAGEPTDIEVDSPKGDGSITWITTQVAVTKDESTAVDDSLVDKEQTAEAAGVKVKLCQLIKDGDGATLSDKTFVCEGFYVAGASFEAPVLENDVAAVDSQEVSADIPKLSLVTSKMKAASVEMEREPSEIKDASQIVSTTLVAQCEGKVDANGKVESKESKLVPNKVVTCDDAAVTCDTSASGIVETDAIEIKHETMSGTEDVESTERETEIASTCENMNEKIRHGTSVDLSEADVNAIETEASDANEKPESNVEEAMRITVPKSKEEKLVDAEAAGEPGSATKGETDKQLVHAISKEAPRVAGSDSATKNDPTPTKSRTGLDAVSVENEPIPVVSVISTDNKSANKENTNSSHQFEVDTKPINAVSMLIGRFEQIAKRKVGEAPTSRSSSRAPLSTPFSSSSGSSENVIIEKTASIESTNSKLTCDKKVIEKAAETDADKDATNDTESTEIVECKDEATAFELAPDKEDVTEISAAVEAKEAASMDEDESENVTTTTSVDGSIVTDAQVNKDTLVAEAEPEVEDAAANELDLTDKDINVEDQPVELEIASEEVIPDAAKEAEATACSLKEADKTFEEVPDTDKTAVETDVEVNTSEVLTATVEATGALISAVDEEESDAKGDENITIVEDEVEDVLSSKMSPVETNEVKHTTDSTKDKMIGCSTPFNHHSEENSSDLATEQLVATKQSQESEEALATDAQLNKDTLIEDIAEAEPKVEDAAANDLDATDKDINVEDQPVKLETASEEVNQDAAKEAEATACSLKEADKTFEKVPDTDKTAVETDVEVNTSEVLIATVKATGALISAVDGVESDAKMDETVTAVEHAAEDVLSSTTSPVETNEVKHTTDSTNDKMVGGSTPVNHQSEENSNNLPTENKLSADEDEAEDSSQEKFHSSKTKMSSVIPEGSNMQTSDDAVVIKDLAKPTDHMAPSSYQELASTDNGSATEWMPERNSSQLGRWEDLTYDILGVTHAKKVVLYHIYIFDRSIGERVRSTSKRYSDFKLLNKQLRALDVASVHDLPLLPKRTVGSFLRGRRSKKTIEVRLKAFEEFLHYIRDHKDLHESAVFQEFITN
ncbi:hypothetical protein PsorP6_005962 [Peronosclerospora sorghi]|uniref:Uncharacterized protein n=1 Tax=Peronosclerospora sorghi TaxID=230839 RepID=A0ACC0W6E7_9STRA|nr:hypothetical protein PsorP6_005962 [Peronosclerospora sorghi]